MDPKAPLASRRTASRRRCTAYGFVLGAVLAICGAGLTHAGSRSSKALSPGHTETAAADIGLRTLLHSLESPVPTTRATAARSAARVAGELHQALVYASGDPDPATRTWSQLALALGGDSAGAEDVERTLGDPAPELREAALRALATSVPRERIPRQVVRPLAGDTDPDVRFSAACLLAYAGDAAGAAELSAALRGRSRNQRVRAAQALADVPSAAREATSHLRALLHQPDSGVQSWSMIALGFAGELDMVPRLGQLLSSDDWELRWYAAKALFALAYMYDPNAVVPLRARALALLADPATKVRVAAARLLMCCGGGDRATPDALVTATTTDSSREVRNWAACALAELGDARSVAELQRLLRGPDQASRLTAARAAACLGEEASPLAADLRCLTEEGDDATRMMAGAALGITGDASVLELLREGCSAERAPIGRLWAAAALARLGDPEGTALRDSLLGDAAGLGIPAGEVAAVRRLL